MKFNHFFIGVAVLSSCLGIAIAPAYAGKVFNMPSFNGRYIDLCASYFSRPTSTDSGSYVCYRGNKAQEIVASAFCRRVGMSYALRWRYTEGSWENRKSVWKLRQDVTFASGYRLRDDPNSYTGWSPAEGGHYFTSIECN